MRTDYSKPLADIFEESGEQIRKDKQLLARQIKLSAILKKCPNRIRCIICGSDLKNMEYFKHRNVEYVLCSKCVHIQTKSQPPTGYPNYGNNGLSFDLIYPELTHKEYESRKNRIYRPKLDWALSHHRETGLSREKMIQVRWLELGCGAGYFLDSLKDIGARNIGGLERDSNLVRLSNKTLRNNWVIHYENSLANAIESYRANIYVAFFVLEHTEDTQTFLKSLSNLPKGTVFLFSVPTFSFATVLESSFENFWARNLDNVIHTQLFTDSSIQYCLEASGFEKKAEWIFGQDSLDFTRLLITHLEGKYPESLLTSVRRDIIKIQNPFQNLLDRHYFSDSRHILAVKK